MSTDEPMSKERLDAIQERAGEVTTLRSADFNDWQELALHLSECVDDLLAEVERLRALTTVTEDMVERGKAAHHEAFNAWKAKRSLEDADNRKSAAMRAALDAALGTGEGS